MPFLNLQDLLYKTGFVCGTCGMKFVVDRSRAFVANVLVLIGVLGAGAGVAWKLQLTRDLTLSRLIGVAVGFPAVVWALQYWVDARLVKIREAQQDEKIDTYLGGV
jgi:hypothetical protein